MRRAAGRLRLISGHRSLGRHPLRDGVGGLWANALHTRYTDRPQVHVHPGLVDSVRIRPLVPGWRSQTSIKGVGWYLEEDAPIALTASSSATKGHARADRGLLPRDQAETSGIRVGQAMRTRLPGTEGGQGLAERLGALAVDGNDLKLPLAPVFMRHLVIKRNAPERFEVASASLVHALSSTTTRGRR